MLQQILLGSLSEEEWNGWGMLCVWHLWEINIPFKSEYLKERHILEDSGVNKIIILRVDWTDLAQGKVIKLGVAYQRIYKYIFEKTSAHWN